MFHSHCSVRSRVGALVRAGWGGGITDTRHRHIDNGANMLTDSFHQYPPPPAEILR